MSSWFSGWSDGAKKRVCRFLIHRYLGHLLKEKLNLDQLSVDIHKEKAQGIVNDVYVDSNSVNELLDAAQAPLRLVDGYLGEISVCIPWSRLFEDSCCMQITNLEITLKPHTAEGLNQNPTDLMSSMLDSVMCSMASSVELARSFLEEEGSPELPRETEEEGVEAFATVIDALLLRMRLTFKDVIIRLEHFKQASQLGTALELRIDRLDFIDEQLKACESNGNSTEPITTQPHSLYKVPDLNKIIEIQGVRLYTDVFSCPFMPESCVSTMQSVYTSVIGMPSSPEGAVYTSMYFRRQKAKEKNRRSADSTPNSLLNSTIECPASAFESCYSSPPPEPPTKAPDPPRGRSLPPPLADDILGDEFKFNETTPQPTFDDGSVTSNPVQFAVLMGKKQIAEIRLKNMALSHVPGEANTKIDIKLYLGSMACLLSPSQLILISDILTSLIGGANPAPEKDASGMGKGKPMGKQDLAKIEQQLTNEVLWKSPKPSLNLASQGNWSGENTFYPTSPKPQRDMQDIDVSSGTDDMKPVPDLKLPKDKAPSSQKSLNNKPEVSHIYVRLNSFWLSITHKDPMALTHSLPAAIESLIETSNKFFKTCETLSISVNTDLRSLRAKCDLAYPFDNLRLVACPLVMDCTLETSNDNTNHVMDICTGNCEVVECLCPDSYMSGLLSTQSSTTLSSHSQDQTSPDMLHLQLLHFSPSGLQDALDEPKLRVCVSNDNQNKCYQMSIELQSCESDIDLTMVDRLYSLIYCNPSFRPTTTVMTSAALFGAQLQNEFSCKMQSTPRSPSKKANNLELFDNIFDANFGSIKYNSNNETVSSIESSRFSISLRCPEWKVNLSIPVADLRPPTTPGRPPWWRRRVHPESILLDLKRTALVCKCLGENSDKSGEVKLTCQEVIGYFSSSGERKECEKFLYASSVPNSKPCGLTFKWDFHNRTLVVDELSPNTPRTGSGSSWGSVIKMPKGREGPFSQQHAMHENEEFTLAGTRSEMNKFRDICMEFMQLGIDINLPRAKLYLQDKDTFELLYNRIANDFALWEPTAPNPTEPSLNLQSLHVTGLKNTSPFLMCKSSVNKEVDSDESDEDASMNKSQQSTLKRRVANRLGLSLKLDSVTVLLGALAAAEDPSVTGDLVLEATSGELFLVSGFEGNSDLAYLYVTASKASIWHQNRISPECSYCTDVCSDVFGSSLGVRTGEDMQAYPNLPNMAASVVNEDNIAVALKLLAHADGIKSILLAVTIRNSCVVYRPFASSCHFWLTQLIEYFTVNDFPVHGYKLPRSRTELHVHLSSSCISYSALSEHLPPGHPPLSARVWVESADITSSIVQEASAFRLHFIFEDIRLFLNQGGISLNSLNKDFIVVLKCGLFELTVTVCEKLNVGLKRPLLEIGARNDLIKIWLCSDSLLALIGLIKSLSIANARSDMGETTPTPTPQTSVSEHSNIDQALKGMVESAMQSVDDKCEGSSSEAYLVPCSSLKSETPSTEQLLDDALFGEGEEEGGSPVVGSFGSNFSMASGDRGLLSSADEEFVIVDEIPGSGIKSRSGEPRIRCLCDAPLNIKENHFAPPYTREDPLTSLPANYPSPLIRYVVREVSISCSLYGGLDFESEAPAKPYSMLTSQVSAQRNSRALAARGDADCAGGEGRDHTVLVQFNVTKLSYVYDLFGPDAPAVGRQLIVVHEVQVQDKVSASHINKLLYQYSVDNKPRLTCKPMICVRLLESGPAEAKLKISVLPLRINVDQDTLQFLQEFGMQVLETLSERGDKSVDKDSSPILEVNSTPLPSTPLPSDPLPSDPVEAYNAIMEESTATLAGLFNDTSGGMGHVTPTSRVCINEASVSFNKSDEDMEEEEDIETNTDLAAVMQRQSSGGSLFFKNFTFSPSVVIRLDYQGKQRVNMDKGAIQGLLMGLTALHCTELTLHQLHHRQGLLGLDKVIAYCVQEWISDIQRKQIPKVIGSVGPMRSLTQIAQGIRDLIWMPVEEYRKEGHVVRGFHKGVASFGVATATASIDIVHRLVAAVQGVAEFAFDVASPEYPPNRRRLTLPGVRHPSDIREGIGMAYDAMADGLNETAEMLHLAAAEERAQGKWPVRGLLRQATPTALRPIVLASRAASHVLGGVRSQLQPESTKEEHEKWK